MARNVTLEGLRHPGEMIKTALIFPLPTIAILGLGMIGGAVGGLVIGAVGDNVVNFFTHENWGLTLPTTEIATLATPAIASVVLLAQARADVLNNGGTLSVRENYADGWRLFRENVGYTFRQMLRRRSRGQ